MLNADRREAKPEDAVDPCRPLSGSLRAFLSGRRRGDHRLALRKLVRIRHDCRSSAGDYSRERCVLQVVSKVL